jgi:sterol desaturase/sphingolipid hydroxylase (fatty acid hydroxylase superfamily)
VYTAVKHYYGFFIHADLPWDYGRFGNVFVSPVMHRWHHSIDQEAHHTNFATIFSLFDRMFGTYRVPGLAVTSLGVESHIGKGFVAQLLYPFKPSAYHRPSGNLPGSISTRSLAGSDAMIDRVNNLPVSQIR